MPHPIACPRTLEIGNLPRPSDERGRTSPPARTRFAYRPERLRFARVLVLPARDPPDRNRPRRARAAPPHRRRVDPTRGRWLLLRGAERQQKIRFRQIIKGFVFAKSSKDLVSPHHPKIRFRQIIQRFGFAKSSKDSASPHHPPHPTRVPDARRRRAQAETRH